MDLDGVALASIKELHNLVKTMQTRIDKLESIISNY